MFKKEDIFMTSLGISSPSSPSSPSYTGLETSGSGSSSSSASSLTTPIDSMFMVLGNSDQQMVNLMNRLLLEIANNKREVQDSVRVLTATNIRLQAQVTDLTAQIQENARVHSTQIRALREAFMTQTGSPPR